MQILSQLIFLITVDFDKIHRGERNGQFINVSSSQLDEAEDIKNMQLYMPNVMAARLAGEDVRLILTKVILHLKVNTAQAVNYLQVVVAPAEAAEAVQQLQNLKSL